MNTIGIEHNLDRPRTRKLLTIPAASALVAGAKTFLVAYDGFNPSEPETEFCSVAWEAKGLEDYILQNYGGLVDENTEQFIQEVDKAHKHTGD